MLNRVVGVIYSVRHLSSFCDQVPVLHQSQTGLLMDPKRQQRTSQCSVLMCKMLLLPCCGSHASRCSDQQASGDSDSVCVLSVAYDSPWASLSPPVIRTCNTRHVDDAALSLPDVGKKSLGDSDHAHQVHLQSAPPDELRSHLDLWGIPDPCVVD